MPGIQRKMAGSLIPLSRRCSLKHKKTAVTAAAAVGQKHITHAALYEILTARSHQIVRAAPGATILVFGESRRLGEVGTKRCAPLEI